jgi:hypothetical protein
MSPESYQCIWKGYILIISFGAVLESMITLSPPSIVWAFGAKANLGL